MSDEFVSHTPPGEHIGDELAIRAGHGLIGVDVYKNCLALGDRGQIDVRAKKEECDCA
jgi:hypothetical protein